MMTRSFLLLMMMMLGAGVLRAEAVQCRYTPDFDAEECDDDAIACSVEMNRPGWVLKAYGDKAKAAGIDAGEACLQCVKEKNCLAADCVSENCGADCEKAKNIGCKSACSQEQERSSETKKVVCDECVMWKNIRTRILGKCVCPKTPGGPADVEICKDHGFGTAGNVFEEDGISKEIDEHLAFNAKLEASSSCRGHGAHPVGGFQGWTTTTTGLLGLVVVTTFMGSCQTLS